MSGSRYIDLFPQPIVIDFEGRRLEDHNNKTDIQGYRFSTNSLVNVFEGEPLYRESIEAYVDVFQKGFFPKGNKTDLVYHVMHHDLGGSAYISTTRSKEVAIKFPEPLRGNVDTIYVYQIHSAQSPIDIVKEFAYHANPVAYKEFVLSQKNEMEMAFTSKINPNEVKGCWKVDILTEVDTARFDLLTQAGCSQEWINEMCCTQTRSLQSNFIANPNYRPPGMFALNSIRGAGIGLTGIGFALDAHSLYQQYQYSKQTGNYQNTFQESNRILAGWTGAFKVGSFFAEKAFIYSACLSPFGQGACTIGAGFAGSLLGYYGGSHIVAASYASNVHHEAIQSTKTIKQNGLTCNVATYANGTRIGKCELDKQLVANNSMNKPTETQKATNLPDHLDVYLGMQKNLEVLRGNPVSQEILPASPDTRLERMQNNLALLQKSSPSLTSDALTQTTSTTAQVMNNLRALNDSHHNMNQCLATGRCDNFSQFTNASRTTHYTPSAAKAAEYTTFVGNYINMNFCEAPSLKNNFSMWKQNGRDGTGKHCDIFGNCGSSNSNNCRSGGSSDRCSISKK